MYIDRKELKDYPFEGVFYTSEIDDKNKPLIEQEEIEKIICTVNCDITQDSHARYGSNIQCVFAVYVPFDERMEQVNVQRGCMFRGVQYGLKVDGKVIGVFPSQIGNPQGYVAYVQANDI